MKVCLFLDEGLWMKDEGLFVGVVCIKLSSFFFSPFFLRPLTEQKEYENSHCHRFDERLSEFC
jgi:hypothetical protein